VAAASRFTIQASWMGARYQPPGTARAQKNRRFPGGFR
jgi:hypothetical protein